jgi:LysR family glycine cleavage system transcriptional activator
MVDAPPANTKSRTPLARMLPSLTSLRAFEAAARQRSFAAAADELCVSRSAISHQIHELEERLGTQLFRRTARGVELTETGAAYYPYLREAFDRIAQGTASIGHHSAGGELILQVYVGVMVNWLVQKLHRFQTAFPDIRLIHLDIASEFESGRGDIGLIWTRRAVLPDLHYTRLFTPTLSPVVAPALLKAGAGLRTPSDLAACTLLFVEGAEDDWQAWLEAAGMSELANRPYPKFDSYLIALEAAIEGQGIAIAPDFIASMDLKAARLVQPFDIRVEQPGAWYLVCNRERQHELRIKCFHDWLVGEVAAEAGP